MGPTRAALRFSYIQSREQRKPATSAQRKGREARARATNVTTRPAGLVVLLAWLTTLFSEYTCLAIWPARWRDKGRGGEQLQCRGKERVGSQETGRPHITCRITCLFPSAAAVDAGILNAAAAARWRWRHRARGQKTGGQFLASSIPQRVGAHPTQEPCLRCARSTTPRVVPYMVCLPWHSAAQARHNMIFWNLCGVFP